MPDNAQQRPMFDVRQFIPNPYPADSIYALIDRFGHLIIQQGDFPPPAAPGQEPRDRVMLTKLVVLMKTSGWPEREATRRATYDLQIKACLGLGIEESGPSQPTICRHLALMQKLGLDETYLDRFIALLRRLDVLERAEPILVDSTPVAGAGQVLDTFNLLAAGIRRALSALAKVLDVDRADLAAELGLERYLARSVKGSFEVDWTDPKQRCEVLDALVTDVETIRTASAGAISESPSLPGKADPEPPAEPLLPGLDPDDAPGSTGAGNGASDAPSASRQPSAKALTELLAAISLLDDVMKHDVERDPAGRVKGVRRRAAGDRPISATDPDMRHGRKSSSVLISGYKAHVSGTTGHGFIMATDVTGANVHDHAPLAMLVRKSRERGLEPPWVVGDRAYGTLANHTAFTADGATELVAPIIRPHNRGLFISDDFDIDLDARRATCPAKQTVDAREVRREGKSGWMFTFPASACGNCPLRDQCTRTAGPKGRSMFIVPAARRIVEARLDRQREPDYRERLAHRPTIERIIAGFGQCGGKRARRFGIEKVTFDVNLSALGYNLRRLARVVAQHPELRARLEAFLRLLVMLLIRRWVAVTFTQGRCRRDAAV